MTIFMTIFMSFFFAMLIGFGLFLTSEGMYRNDTPIVWAGLMFTVFSVMALITVL